MATPNLSSLRPPAPGSAGSSSLSSAASSLEYLPQHTPLGYTTTGSIATAVAARRTEFIRKKTIKLKVGTWNTAAMRGTRKDLGGWFVKSLGIKGLAQDLGGLGIDDSDSDTEDQKIESVIEQEKRFAEKKTTLPANDVAAIPGNDEIDLYVLGLQEVVDITSMTEAVRPYTDPNPAKKWKRAMRKALPKGYHKVAEQQLLGLLILIYASEELFPDISAVDATSVGTGLMGYLGNKGAVSARILLGETTKLCFVNSHLAAGADEAALTRRIWDTNQIIARTRFSAITPSGHTTTHADERIGDEDYTFWFGDLNFRLDDIPGEDVRRLLLLHTRNEYDVLNESKRKVDSELGYVHPPPNPGVKQDHHDEISDVEQPASASDVEPPLDPKNDPASLYTTLQALLKHDQLRNQQRSGKVFHDGWREGDVDFLPTYKYDVGSVGMFDSGEKKRSPSWCDRILFRSRLDRLKYEEKRQQSLAQFKDPAAATPLSEQSVLYDYDPATDGLAYGDDYDEDEDSTSAPSEPRSKHEEKDPLVLDHYVSHQRVLSSDHKPLDAVFTLTYDAIIPELRNKVQDEVVRDMDKAENEGRPAVTVVLDNHSEGEDDFADDQTENSEMSEVVHFGQVRYKVKKTRTITIANTGQVDATVSFVERPSEVDPDGRKTPPWLTIHILDADDANLSSPQIQTTLAPGDSVPVEITVDVSDATVVRNLNEGKYSMDDVLVLRVSHGRDHFIPVKGTWLPSCFHRGLNELVLVPDGGVRSLPKSATNRDSTGRNNIKSSTDRHSAPKELFTLTDTIPSTVERCVAEWEMLHEGQSPPWQAREELNRWPFDPKTWMTTDEEQRSVLAAKLRECVDKGQPLEEAFGSESSSLIRVEVLAEVLMDFLQSLRDGMINGMAWGALQDRLSKEDKFRDSTPPSHISDIVMDVLATTPVHSVSLSFLVFMLLKVINEVNGNQPAAINSPRLSSRSRASTLSSETDAESFSRPLTPTERTKNFFSPILRRRTQTSETSVSGYTGPSASARKTATMKAYAEIFAPLIIRVSNEQQIKGKERKTLETRRVKVFESLLQASTV